MVGTEFLSKLLIVGFGRVTRLIDRISNSSLEIVEISSALTQIPVSLEYLSLKSERRTGGLNNWDHLQYQFRPPKTAIGRWMLQFLAKENVYRTVHVARVGAALVLVFPVRNNLVRAVANSFLGVTTVALHPVQLYGTDGSDQLSFIVHSAAGLGRFGGTDNSRRSASDFIGAQTMLSYGAGGLAKLAGKDWRSGDALSKVMRTETYGDAGVSHFLESNPWLGRLVSKVTLAWEIGFPFMMLNRSVALVALGTGAVFHSLNARLMGLWRFAPPFIASYPAVWRLVHR